MLISDQTIAVAYLARGADKEWLLSFERFLESYRRYPSGIKHRLYIIFKGFSHGSDLELAKTLFSTVTYRPVMLSDDSLDIGAYIEWANQIKEKSICVFNTASEILAANWLQKLSVNLAMPDVGLVGVTASYESLKDLNSAFPAFPNVHLRSTGFMIERELFCSLTEELEIKNKFDAFHFESGPKSISRQVLAKGKKILLVGRNGRGYAPIFWPTSNTFRQGTQQNLLVADNQTRNFLASPWSEKREIVLRTWGKYIMKNKMRTSNKGW